MLGIYEQLYRKRSGYLTNPDATLGCQFCAYRRTDEYLAKSFNIFYSHRWRDFALTFGYIAFNVC